MEKQVGKSDVFTKESLIRLQDKMRTLCIEEFNQVYSLDSTLKQNQNLKLKKEAREIHESIQKSLKRDSISFQTRWATRIINLLQYINEVNSTILHFSGYGASDGKLVFQDNNDKQKLLY